jgi:hypothetical protein
MAWTASVLDKDANFVYLEFQKDGVRVFADKYPIPEDGNAGIPRLVRIEIARLIAKDAPIVVGPVTPEADPTPDPDETIKQTFETQLNLRRQLQKAVDLGLVAANDPRYLTQITNLKALFDAQTQAVQLKIINLL